MVGWLVPAGARPGVVRFVEEGGPFPCPGPAEQVGDVGLDDSFGWPAIPAGWGDSEREFGQGEEPFPLVGVVGESGDSVEGVGEEVSPEEAAGSGDAFDDGAGGGSDPLPGDLGWPCVERL
ncbi:MAG: hypothetical protein GY938_32755, partial [Ketobacter sp.]|nr:hypothetical protein [Ketobacter sp.]